ncbi:recombinase family protein [Gordonia paraffinivorans]|uniref:recombinase family protein n=1 Tax=Gordonia paraffinivorans TaxID=175628 RepID=UPI001445DDA2|nr:recombinase family protein [Gordonia paraffinivorans]
MKTQRIGYKRVSTIDQHTERQLDGVVVDKVFEDKASGKSTQGRPELERAIDYVREGDTLVAHSMDRLARNLDDLRAIVNRVTAKGAKVEFVKEGMTFTGADSAIDKLLLSLRGAVAEFERELIRERQREGIALAKRRGIYKGGKPKLTADQAAEVASRVVTGESVAALAREYGVSRQTIYRYAAQTQTSRPAARAYRSRAWRSNSAAC